MQPIRRMVGHPHHLARAVGCQAVAGAVRMQQTDASTEQRHRPHQPVPLQLSPPRPPAAASSCCCWWWWQHSYLVCCSTQRNTSDTVHSSRSSRAGQHRRTPHLSVCRRSGWLLMGSNEFVVLSTRRSHNSGGGGLDGLGNDVLKAATKQTKILKATVRSHERGPRSS